MTETCLNIIKQRLKDQLSPIHLVIEDDSERHKNHRGRGSGGHYNVLIVSDNFTGQNLIQRHRKVYDTLADMIPQDIHALSIKALAPKEHTPKDA